MADGDVFLDVEFEADDPEGIAFEGLRNHVERFREEVLSTDD